MARAAASSSSSSPRAKAASAQEPPIIGFEGDKAKIIDSMLDSSHPELSFIAITGKEGVGKTTLAREIYASAELQQEFDVHIWVSYAVDILDEMGRQIIGVDKREIMSRSRKREELREHLNGKRYCLVIDNCWISDYHKIGHWDEISEALPDHENGSRVLLICSASKVKVSTPQVLICHEVDLRSEEEGMDILLKAANLNLPTINTMPGMLDLLRNCYLPLCQGLPWPLRFMGSLLSMLAPNLQSWTDFHRTIAMKYPTSNDFVSKLAMKLRHPKCSYDGRAAFLSFLTYPPNAHIHVQTLFLMWITMNIVEDEIVAGYMLEDFVDQSIVQVGERPLNGRLVKVCQMVDPLVCALAVQEAKEKRYARVCSNPWEYIYIDLFSPHVQVHKIYVKKGDDFNAEQIDVTHLYDATCCIFNWSSETDTVLSWSGVLEVDNSQNMRDVERVLMKMGSPRYLGLRNSGLLPQITNVVGLLDHLETLVVEVTPLETLPPDLLRENMLLKHLILTDTKLQEIPFSIQKLKFLNTLNVSGAPIKTLPEFIGNLKHLRTLVISGTSLKILPDFIGIGNLINLQTLDASSTFIETIPDSMINLHDLQTLDISNTLVEIIPEFIGELKELKSLKCSGAPIKSLPESIRYLENLYTLDISGTSIDTIDPYLFYHFTFLGTLNVSNTPIKTLPVSIGALKNLWTIDISGTFIQSIPSSVWTLPRLRSVFASDCFRHLDGPPNSINDINIETLTIDVLERWNKKAVPKLPALRELGLSNYKHARIHNLKNYWRPAFNLLRTLENLSSLKLQGRHIPTGIIDVGICPSYNETLTQLWVGGSQSLFSLHDITMPPRLTNLTLENLEFEEDPMPKLGKLQHLKILQLRWLLLDATPAARKMTCSSDSFPCLEELGLCHLTGLEEWLIEEGAMPKLTHVLIRNCKKLKKLPDSLLQQRETALCELHLHSMPSAFTEHLSQRPFLKGLRCHRILIGIEKDVGGIKIAAFGEATIVVDHVAGDHVLQLQLSQCIFLHRSLLSEIHV